jgi:hypothetical protein
MICKKVINVQMDGTTSPYLMYFSISPNSSQKAERNLNGEYPIALEHIANKHWGNPELIKIIDK